MSLEPGTASEPPDVERRFEKPLQKWEYLFLLAFWVAIVAGAVWQSGKEYFDNDELCTALLVSNASFSEMWGMIRHGGELNPPLFFVIEWVIARIAGSGETALRAISFVSVAFGGWVLFFTLRPFTGPRVATLSIALVLGLSRTTFYLAGRARYYAFFFLLVTIAIWLTMRLRRRSELRWTDYLSVFLIHCSMVYLHLFGLVFSGALLLAMMAADLLVRNWRWKLYSCVIAAWVAFGAWVPYVGTQVKSAGAYTPPGYHTIGFFLDQLSLETPYAPIFILVALLGGLALMLPRSGGTADEAASCNTPLDWALLVLLAGALLALPVATWLGSFVITALFMPRYVFPSIAGYVVLTALILVALLRLPRGSFQFKWTIPPAVWTAAWLAILAFGLFFQPMRAWKNPSRPAQPFIDAEFGDPNLPMVFENSFPYIKRAWYGRNREYMLFTDPEASKADPNWYTGFIMRYFDHYYPRYQRFQIVHYDDLPETFLAIDDDMTRTFEWLFEHKPALKTQLLGTRKSELEYFGNERVFLVQRTRNQPALGANRP
jgi:hypothetical protein